VTSVDSKYQIAFNARLEKLAPGLSADVELKAGTPSGIGGLKSLDASTQQRVFDFLIECACLSQSEEAIRLGTLHLRQAPRTWVIEHLKQVTTRQEFHDDEYAFRRMMTLCERLDPGFGPGSNPVKALVLFVVEAGLKSSDPDVRNFAQRCRVRLSGERTPEVTFEVPTGVRALLLEQSEPWSLAA
jgi:hypothetical protein